MLCVDKDTKPGQDIPGSYVREVCTSEIETTQQLSGVRLSDVSCVECSLSRIREEMSGATDGVIITEECIENRVEKCRQSEHASYSQSDTSFTVLDINQEAQDSGESRVRI